MAKNVNFQKVPLFTNTSDVKTHLPRFWHSGSLGLRLWNSESRPRTAAAPIAGLVGVNGAGPAAIEQCPTALL